jgi:hypothetical protein
VPQHPAGQIVSEFILHIPRQLVLLVPTPDEKGLQILGQHPVKQGLLWHPALVGKSFELRRDIHRTPYRSVCSESCHQINPGLLAIHLFRFQVRWRGLVPGVARELNVELHAGAVVAHEVVALLLGLS